MTLSANRNPMKLALMTLLASSSLLLAACQTTGTPSTSANQVDQALERAANESKASGQESLPLLEKLYKRNPDDVNVAVRYSRALRDANRLTRASIVIAPFAKNERKPNAAAKTEYAAVQVALGNYEAAQEFASKAVVMDENNYQAYHILGIALDAQGDHKPAENAYRKGLAIWQGNPTPILNNLGLNLASQGFLDEAAEVLRRALETSPDRTEVERNLRIVSALRQSGGRAPSYLQKQRDAENAAAQKTENKAESKTENKAETSTPVPAAKPKAKTPE